MIYLDNASTTQLSPKVLKAMLPYMSCGNPASVHSYGREAKDAIETAREQVAHAIGAEPRQIFFTSGGSEANATLLKGIRRHCSFRSKPKIAASAVEHDSVLRYVDYTVPVRKTGLLKPADLDKNIVKQTGVLCAMLVNNETGAVNDVAALSKYCRERDMLLLVDCVQALGSVPIDVDAMGIDLATFSAHKIHGPKGVGAMYIRYPGFVDPLVKGGDDQESGMRGGTPNVAGIVGFGAAAELSTTLSEEKACSAFKNVFFDKLVKSFGTANGMYVNEGFPDGKTVAKILSITFDSVDAETLVLALDAQGICISAGAACSSSSSEPSHVLTALGLSDVKARHTVRISFSEDNNEDEIGYAAVTMAETVKELRLQKKLLAEKEKINGGSEGLITKGETAL